jgi:hypothetical protein
MRNFKKPEAARRRATPSVAGGHFFRRLVKRQAVTFVGIAMTFSSSKLLAVLAVTVTAFIVIWSAGLQSGQSPPATDRPAADDVPHDAKAATERPAAPSPSINDLIVSPEEAKEFSQGTEPDLAQQRRERNETVWKSEVQAQRYERAIVRLWDQLLAEERKPNGDAYSVFRGLGFNTISIGKPERSEEIDLGIRVHHFASSSDALTPAQWVELLKHFEQENYHIVQSEWHHAEFDPPGTQPARSKITMALYLDRHDPLERVVVAGNVRVVWRSEFDPEGIPVPDSIEAHDLSVWVRSGKAAFREVFTRDHAQPDTRSGVQPVIAHDVDGDGLSDLLLAGSNELLRNRDHGKFQIEQLCTQRERIFETGLVADFDGDGISDLLVPGVKGDLLLFRADQEGRFTSPPLGKAKGGGPLRQPQVITAGDIDLDGDLDVWVGQYKISYIGGQMPTPYYDANDGFPAYLLVNDGKGRFQPMTEEAGLGAKQFRRSYGGCFVDLDDDLDLDLLVVSDFAGIDVYTNDGHGYFSDVTNQIVDDRHIFGMSVTFGDYDLDGRLDFFVTGMASTTARRLDYMKLGRRDRPDVHMMRSRMGYGNRMYLAKGNRYEEPAFRDQVARTGWSWGAASIDFDNDGDRDIFVANGHSSGASTKDHCTHFWCHDIYDGTSTPDLETDSVFRAAMQGYYDRSESWDGYQKNALLLNRAGRSFANIGFLLGLGHQYDGRAVVGDDIDADGRVDLIVVEDRWNDGQVLHVYRNELPTENHWIGVSLRQTPNGLPPLGARVVVKTPKGQQIGCVVAGDSIHAQHAPKLHFGLGPEPRVESIRVVWPNGHQAEIISPAVDRYHQLVDFE